MYVYLAKFVTMYPFGFNLMLRLSFAFLDFFFPCAWTIISHDFTVQGKKYYSCTVHGFHDTIHTFKNYFAIVFSVFNFSKNKFNPNRPYVYTKIEVGCKCPTKGDSEYSWQLILLPNTF